MAVIEDGRRIIDQDTSLVIAPDDSLIIDSSTNGTRQITYASLCDAVAATLGIDAIKTKADGAMQKSTYDKNSDGIVDNAAALGGHATSYFATASDLTSVKKTADSAMQKSTYDSDGDGIVDNAAKVNSHTVYTDVPAKAVFTDTVYDDTEIKKSIEENSKEIQDLKDNSTLGLKVVNGELCAVYGN